MTPNYRDVVTKMMAFLEAESKARRHRFEVSAKVVAAQHLAKLEALIQSEVAEAAAEQGTTTIFQELLKK